MVDDVEIEQTLSFVELLKRDFPDHRDERGKRHSLVFTITAFVLGILRGRSTVSGIHRFIESNLPKLHELTGIPQINAISRAHLPRLVAGLDWPTLDRLIERSFGKRIAHKVGAKVWIAIDGKMLRGTLFGDEKQSVVLATTHGTREVVGQARQIGSKSSEIPVTRALLRDTGLDKQNVTLDAHHCNPLTTAQIQQAGGVYLTQVKENQEVLLRQCEALAESQPCVASVTENDKEHGRVTMRRAQIFPMASVSLDPRWEKSNLSTCVVVSRETYEVAKEKTTTDTSYYISNQAIHDTQPEVTVAELAQAVRNHWGVESDNWIRDVTFKEDKVKTNSGKQGQIMGRLRSLGMALIRKTSPKNFQAAVDKFADSFPALEVMLRKVKFL